MSRSVKLPGRDVTDQPALQEQPSAFLNVELRAATAVDAQARGTGAELSVVKETKPTDVVEVEFNNGLKQWFSIAQLEVLRGEQAKTAQRSAPPASAPLVSESAPGELVIPAIWVGAETKRGWVEGAAQLGAKFVRLLRPSLDAELKAQLAELGQEQAAQMTAKVIAEYFERKIEKQINPAGEGLYRFRYPQTLEARLTSADLNNQRPYLLFVHGTASSSVSSFSRLGIRHETDQLKIETTPEWEHLQRRYDERVIAFEHRTLSKSPLANAVELAQMLPDGARLHLVSHSRGGLVGELLCLSQVRELSQAGAFQSVMARLELPFATAQRADDLKHLRQLIEILRSKQFQIERFVRVACPARGTKLASQKINDFFGSIVNLLDYVPWVEIKPVLDFARSTLLALLQYPTDPQKLPGIEAMMPESPFIQMLNGAGVVTESDLAVIAGDIAPGDLLDRLKFSAVEKLFSEDNDLVVNTRAMTGGLRRAQGAAFELGHQGAEVNHFSYFRNHRTRSGLSNWLTSDEPPAARATPSEFKALLMAEETIAPDVTRGTRAPRPDNQPVVFVLPGIMGSHLSIGSNRIWLDAFSLALGQMTKLSLDAVGVVPDGLVSSAYRNLVEYLKAGHEVIPFAYDWRLSLKKSADRLKDEVARELQRHARPIRFIAHSMGGLVVRTMIARHPAVWEELKKRDCRLVMLGTPNGGSFVIPQLLAGQEKLFRLLAVADLKNDRQTLLKIISAYEGLLEMLPESFLKAEGWNRLQYQGRDLLSRPASAWPFGEVIKLRREWAKGIDKERMFYVAGTAASTPDKIDLEDGALVFYGTSKGDGRVTHETGRLEGVKTWYAPAEHGDLADHKPSFGAYDDLLNKGTTDKLSTTPLTVRGTAPEGHVILPAEPQMFPDAADLTAAALGRQLRQEASEERHELKISVVHGHLRNAKYPIAVGHYEDDPIVGAERVIDRLLNNRLSQLRQIGLYPGPAGTAEVVRVKDALLKPDELAGALVVGLGEYGAASPERVRNGITAAALRYATRVLNEDPKPADKPYRSVAFSSLLLGTYSSSTTSVAESLSAITRGVMQANRILRQEKLWDEVRIDRVEIVELYEDIATQAIRAAHRLSNTPPLELNADEVITLDPPVLKHRPGGLPQRPPDQYGAGWWRRIKIAMDKRPEAYAKEIGEKAETAVQAEQRLSFTVLSERARLEEQLLPTQRRLIEKLIEQAINLTQAGDRLGLTLFELLVPNALKEQVSSEGDLLLFVDRHSAHYPWELMAQRTQNGSLPLISGRGMVRQLVTDDYRPNPQPAQGNGVLIVGDPKLDSKVFTQLPGAKQEAEMVKSKLTNDGRFTVTASIGQNPLTIFNRLFEADYRIIHLAGHGDYKERTSGRVTEPPLSGMVLGDDLWLTAAEIGQLRIVPDLVFINCCYLGGVDRRPQTHKLAASISLELIRMGVKAVIAAGWEVNDDAAKVFAEVFYDRLLADDTFGGAVRAARGQVYRDYRDTNTWGAYQCYGNPDFRLRHPADSERRKEALAPLFSAREYRNEVRRKVLNADLSDAAKQRLSDWLRDFYGTVPTDCLDARMLAILGDAWARLGGVPESIDFYERACLDEQGNVTLKSLQDLANLRGKHALKLRREADKIAVERGRRGKGKPRTAEEKRRAELLTESRKLFDSEEELLGKLRQLGATVELLSLLGSHFKRRAQAAEGDKFRTPLRKAATHYEEAANLSRQKRGELNPYPALNWIACQTILRATDEIPSERWEKVQTALTEVEQVAQNPADESDIWHRLYLPDALLLRYLLKGALPTETASSKPREDAKVRAQIVERYQQVLKGRVNHRELDSVLGQMTFLLEMFRRVPGPAAQAQIITLTEIHQRIAAALAENA